MSDALASTVIELKKSIDRLCAIVEGNGHKAEVATDVIGALSAMVHELAVAVHEVAEAIPPGKGNVDGTPDESG